MGIVKVKFIESISGANFSYHATQVAEVSSDLADEWIHIGFCEPIDPKYKPAALDKVREKLKSIPSADDSETFESADDAPKETANIKTDKK